MNHFVKRNDALINVARSGLPARYVFLAGQPEPKHFGSICKIEPAISIKLTPSANFLDISVGWASPTKNHLVKMTVHAYPTGKVEHSEPFAYVI